MTNSIRQKRQALGLTQRQLADLVGTSQQQIQRIEAGLDAGLDLAVKICANLRSPIEEVFPSTYAAFARLKTKNPAKKGEAVEVGKRERSPWRLIVLDRSKTRVTVIACPGRDHEKAFHEWCGRNDSKPHDCEWMAWDGNIKVDA